MCGDAVSGVVAFARQALEWTGSLARDLPAGEDQRAAQAVRRLSFLLWAEGAGFPPPVPVAGILGQERDLWRDLEVAWARFVARYTGSRPAATGPGARVHADRPLRRVAEEMLRHRDRLASAPIDALGRVYEALLARSAAGARKASGVYYTPDVVILRLVSDTLLRRCASMPAAALRSVRIVDPSCGSGALLLTAYRALCDLLAARGRVGGPLSPAAKRRVLRDSVFGVDLDPEAVEVTRLSLALAAGVRGEEAADALANIRCGNALIAPEASELDAPGEPVSWPSLAGAAGFDVVLGNPPWGQKRIRAPADLKAYLRDRFPSSRGIFDWFRPFVELAVRLTREGGSFGMVLPDIVLLKNYEETRRFLLDELALTSIRWIGMAFSDATIDAVTIAGRRGPAPGGHLVEVEIAERGAARRHRVPQACFRETPRHTFNLHLTDERRETLAHLERFPRLGDAFEVHEGVHSGNIRAELFVGAAVDESCRRLLFGRGELRPYRLAWGGRFLRLSALPERRTPERYANLGRPAWHESPKVLVRRTGDRVSAARDSGDYYASNNFFLVLPAQPAALTLDALTALLNSSFFTWLFRCVEPRAGRAFAEIKVKHLVTFPLPLAADPRLVELDRLGAERRRLGAAGDDPDLDRDLDAAIDALVPALLAVEERDSGEFTPS
jgi:hypothetical protein